MYDDHETSSNPWPDMQCPHCGGRVQIEACRANHCQAGLIYRPDNETTYYAADVTDSRECVTACRNCHGNGVVAWCVRCAVEMVLAAAVGDKTPDDDPPRERDFVEPPKPARSTGRPNLKNASVTRCQNRIRDQPDVSPNMTDRVVKRFTFRQNGDWEK